MSQREAEIVVNGHVLTSAQASTIRVALENMAMFLHSDGLGDDEHGKEMTKLYMQHIAAIRILAA